MRSPFASNGLVALGLTLALASSAELAAQTTWVVDLSGRPGANFLDLNAAVPAVADGDVLLIRTPLPGAVTRYILPQITGRSLVLVGEKVAGVARPEIWGSLNIASIPTGTAIVFEGLHLNTQSVDVRNSLGSLVFSGCELQFTNPSTIADTALVLFHECSVGIAPGPLPSNNLTMMQVLRSTAHFENTSVRLSFLFSASSGVPAPLYVTDSVLHLTASQLRGGVFATNTSGVVLYSTGPAVRLNGTSTLVAAAGSVLESGTYLRNGFPAYPSQAVIAPDYFAQARVERDASVHWNGEQVTDYLVDVVVPRDGLRAHTAEGTLTVEHFTRPNALSVLMLAPLSPPILVLGVGALHLDPAVAVTDLAVAPFGRPTMRAYSIPAAIPLGSWIALQAGSLSTTGIPAVSNVSIAGIF